MELGIFCLEGYLFSDCSVFFKDFSLDFALFGFLASWLWHLSSWSLGFLAFGFWLVAFWFLGFWLFGFLAFAFWLFGFLACWLLGFLAFWFLDFWLYFLWPLWLLLSASSASPVTPQHHRLSAFWILGWWLLTSHVSVDGGGCPPPNPPRFFVGNEPQ